MSLKAFHLFFIALSVVLVAFTAAWAASQYREVHEPGYFVTAIGLALAGVALTVYGVKFQRKARQL